MISHGKHHRSDMLSAGDKSNKFIQRYLNSFKAKAIYHKQNANSKFNFNDDANDKEEYEDVINIIEMTVTIIATTTRMK